MPKKTKYLPTVAIRKRKIKPRSANGDNNGDNNTDDTTRKIRRLTLEQKVFIVRGFAQYLTAQQIVDRLKEEYDIDVMRQHAQQYHPNYMLRCDSSRKCIATGTRITGQTFGEIQVERGTRPDIGLTWQEVFDKERKQVDDNPYYVPISRRTVRLGYVDRKVRKLDRSDDNDSMEIMNRFLQYAMREMGGGGGNSGPNVQVIQSQLQAQQAQGIAILQSEDYQRASAELAAKLARRPDVLANVAASMGLIVAGDTAEIEVEETVIEGDIEVNEDDDNG